MTLWSSALCFIRNSCSSSSSAVARCAGSLVNINDRNDSSSGETWSSVHELLIIMMFTWLDKTNRTCIAEPLIRLRLWWEWDGRATKMRTKSFASECRGLLCRLLCHWNNRNSSIVLFIATCVSGFNWKTVPSRILRIAFIGSMSKLGGCPSSISITITPNDQISTWKQLSFQNYPFCT